MVVDLTPNILKRGKRFVCSLTVLHSDRAATEWSGPDRLATRLASCVTTSPAVHGRHFLGHRRDACVASTKMKPLPESIFHSTWI